MFNKKYTVFVLFALLPLLLPVAPGIAFMLESLMSAEPVNWHYDLKEHYVKSAIWIGFVVFAWLLADTFSPSQKSENTFSSLEKRQVMANSRLHLICGNCGCNDKWSYGIDPHVSDIDDKLSTSVYLSCGNCDTLHDLADTAQNSHPSQKLGS